MDLEPYVWNHFEEKYYALLLNLESSPVFYNDWIEKIQKMAKDCKALYFAVLANAASHISAMDDSSGMQQLAIRYYSISLENLARSITAAGKSQGYDTVLMVVIFLYLHGCIGLGTYEDIPCHLNAAIKIIKLQFLRRQDTVIRGTFDRLAVESVLYQIFLVTTSYWSKHSTLPRFDFDDMFWLDCENLLSRSTMFPGSSTSWNSPVLGVPISLFRLNIRLRQMYDHPDLNNDTTLARMKKDVTEWEEIIASTEPDGTDKQTICDDGMRMYVLVASLLVEELARKSTAASSQSDSANKWQLKSLLDIVRRREADKRWHRAFVANWPLYTAGFFVTSVDDMRLIRAAMEKRREASKVNVISRLKTDLERTWAHRGLS
ncbi:uncharacterized protein PV09_09363 [Verruconis gallopava]|uniref:Transcription factor domain-containing protein n=1 Tax=Verruconis gallopava TaxID=253628 RepID=A0A0D1YDW8_9PEZI|nr:uncharacterized protein PV09_09363 [Verruconis gallopava]KIV98921.1 hypothetical protein PV09_09363 [Verruconis gallopava]